MDPEPQNRQAENHSGDSDRLLFSKLPEVGIVACVGLLTGISVSFVALAVINGLSLPLMAGIVTPVVTGALGVPIIRKKIAQLRESAHSINSHQQHQRIVEMERLEAQNQQRIDQEARAAAQREILDPLSVSERLRQLVVAAASHIQLPQENDLALSNERIPVGDFAALAILPIYTPSLNSTNPDSPTSSVALSEGVGPYLERSPNVSPRPVQAPNSPRSSRSLS